MLKPGEPDDYKDLLGAKSPRDTYIQIGFSVLLGFGAFLAFCILRPRWASLYAARKNQRNQASPLPELPTSMLGWVPALLKITEQQTLASAGLDAYVYLRFFKLAMKFLTVTLFFALAVIKPVHDAFPDPHSDGNTTSIYLQALHSQTASSLELNTKSDGKNGFRDQISTDYLWMYLVFAYLFTALAIYLMSTETERIIDIRQEYLGNQSTITDRTIRLSGIPPSMRSEDKIKSFIEGLEIGKVDSVMLCRNWKEIDDLVLVRMEVLRKLEEAWTSHLGQERKRHGQESLPVARAPSSEPGDATNDAQETDRLLGPGENGDTTALLASGRRPQASIRYGFMKLRRQYVDAIDYYEEKIRRIDEQIAEYRKQSFQPAEVAFVTMDTVAASQMAVQAVLDPKPMHLIAGPAPAPADVVWTNTYLPRSRRVLRGWTITLAISILTVFWSLVLVPVAGILNLENIKKVWPQLADALQSNGFAESLVTTQLPTLLSTLLFTAVPFLYDWLSNLQGIMSQGDIELSVISKNFFFAFFNYFVVFTILGTVADFYRFFDHFQKSLKDTTWVANQLALSLQGLLTFYTNLIMLQGIGLLPFRLLEFGSVALYPFYRFTAKTPRDYAELDEPPVFNYGFYLPQVILIFIICVVYSVLRDSWKVLLCGLIYFAIGAFVYKYQLLYAMEHRQHSTGKAWTMICRRITVGIIVFQLTTAGQLALHQAFKRSIAIVPLIIGTIWFSYGYSRNCDALMKFIALRSIVRHAPELDPAEADPDGWGDTARLRYEAESHAGRTVDENEETGKRYANPSIIARLPDVWLYDRGERDEARASSPRRRLTSTLNALG